MQILEVLHQAVTIGAADVFLVAGLPVTLKCDGRQQRLENGMLIPANEELITDIDKDNKTISLALPEGILDL